MFAFTLQLKLNIRSYLSSKQPPSTDYDYLLAQTVMVSIDSMVLVIAKNQLKQNGIFFCGISEKYSFKGGRPTRLTKRLLVNAAKYFERKAKKPRAI